MVVAAFRNAGCGIGMEAAGLLLGTVVDGGTGAAGGDDVGGVDGEGREDGMDGRLGTAGCR